MGGRRKAGLPGERLPCVADVTSLFWARVRARWQGFGNGPGMENVRWAGAVSGGKNQGGRLGLVAIPSQGGGRGDQSILIGEHVTPWPRCLTRGSAALLRLALAWKEQVAAGTQWQRGTRGRVGKRDQRGRSLHLGWEHPCLPPAPGPLFPLLPVLLSGTLSSH